MKLTFSPGVIQFRFQFSYNRRKQLLYMGFLHALFWEIPYTNTPQVFVICLYNLEGQDKKSSGKKSMYKITKFKRRPQKRVRVRRDTQLNWIMSIAGAKGPLFLIHGIWQIWLKSQKIDLILNIILLHGENFPNKGYLQ